MVKICCRLFDNAETITELRCFWRMALVVCPPFVSWSLGLVLFPRTRLYCAQVCVLELLNGYPALGFGLISWVTCLGEVCVWCGDGQRYYQQCPLKSLRLMDSRALNVCFQLDSMPIFQSSSVTHTTQSSYHNPVWGVLLSALSNWKDIDVHANRCFLMWLVGPCLSIIKGFGVYLAWLAIKVCSMCWELSHLWWQLDYNGLPRFVEFGLHPQVWSLLSGLSLFTFI